MNIRHIIWDWNGTLLDDAWLCLEVMNGCLQKRGMPRLTPERYAEVFELPIINYYLNLGFDFEKESFEVAGKEFMDEYNRRREEPKLREHARALIDRFKETGIEQHVLSAYQHDTLVSLLQHHGLDQRFTDIQGIDHIYAASKVEQGHGMMERLNIDPASVLLIGDTDHDAEVAEALGVHCRLVTAGNQTRAKLEACGVPVVDCLTEIAEEIGCKL